MDKDRVIDIIEMRLNTIMFFKEENLKRWEERRLVTLRNNMRSNLQAGKIMPWLGLGLRRSLVFNASLSGIRINQIIHELKREIFPVVYAQKIAAAKREIDDCYGSDIRTTGQLRQVDKRLYEICQLYLKKDGKLDLDIISTAFGMTFYSGRSSARTKIVQRISGALEFLNSKIITKILLSYSKDKKRTFSYDEFLEYKGNCKFIDDDRTNKYDLEIPLIHYLSTKELYSKLRINMCYEIKALAKTGDIYPHELMLAYLQAILEPSIRNKKKYPEEVIRDQIASIIKVFFTTLREIE